MHCPADVGKKLLEMCQRNIQRNLADLNHTGSVIVRELDWREPFQCQGTYIYQVVWCTCVTV